MMMSSSTSTTPRSRLTIPLCQRIALFACRGPKQAFFLAVTNELFRETMIDYNTMHTVFCRRLWQDVRDALQHIYAFEFVLRVAENNVTWIVQILISALHYSCQRMKDKNHKWEFEILRKSHPDLERNHERKLKVISDYPGVSIAVHRLVEAALRHPQADLTLELLQACKIVSSFESMSAVGGYLGEKVRSLVMEACFNCRDVRVMKELRSWFHGDWLTPILYRRDAEERTTLEVACSMHSTAPDAVEFFTEMLTFDENAIEDIWEAQQMGHIEIIDSLSASFLTVCECTDQPELVELFDRTFRGLFEDRINITLDYIWQGRSASCRSGEFPLSAAASNCHHRVLLTVMSCIRKLTNSRIVAGCLALELYKKTNTGFTPFLTAVAKGLIKNVKLLIAQSESKEEYQEKWLNEMVDMKGRNAIALCGDANEELKDFLLQEDCWEVSRRFYAQEMEKFSELKKESGARRQREEGEAD